MTAKHASNPFRTSCLLLAWFSGMAVPFHHPPRKIESVGALDLKAKILPAKNFGAAFFPWHKLDPLAVLVLPLPHDIGQAPVMPRPFTMFGITP